MTTKQDEALQAITDIPTIIDKLQEYAKCGLAANDKSHYTAKIWSDKLRAYLSSYRQAAVVKENLTTANCQDERVREEALNKCRNEREPHDGPFCWTVGEVVNYRGFFICGWNDAMSYRHASAGRVGRINES